MDQAKKGGVLIRSGKFKTGDQVLDGGWMVNSKLKTGKLTNQLVGCAKQTDNQSQNAPGEHSDGAQYAL